MHSYFSKEHMIRTLSNSVKVICSSCNSKRLRSCLSCYGCGYCLLKNDVWKCMKGSVIGPHDSKYKCIEWKY